MKFALKAFVSLMYLHFFANTTLAQTDTAQFSRYQDELVELYQQVSKSKPQDRITAEKVFFDKFMITLSLEGSNHYTFKKLPYIGRITSPDGNLTIHSWNFQDQFGYSNYYCIMQYYSKKEKITKTFPLTEDQKGFIEFPDRASTLSIWYGSLYYEIVETKYKNKIYYTLLGFNSGNVLSNKKIIETVSLSEFGDIEFVPNLFHTAKRSFSRIVYEFAERAQITLKYDPILKMIVADHLSPQKPSMEGQFQFYGPDGSYDAFEFTNGLWQQKTNIQIQY